MFLLFETDVPQYMYVPIKHSTSENTDSNDNSVSGIAKPDSELVDYEQGPPGMGPSPDEMQPELEAEANNDQQEQKELEPLKKLYLLQKLTKLNDALEDNSYVDPKLKIVIKYGANFSYPTLLSISDKIITGIQSTIEPEKQSSVQGG